MKDNILLKSVLILSFVLLSACQEEKDNLQTYIATLKLQPKTGIEPLPVVKEQVIFNYTANDLRDPFQAVPTNVIVEEKNEEVVDDNGLHPDEDRRKEALEAFPLEELQMVGTLENDVIWALIRTPEGIIHRVKAGNYMGQNDGQILVVSESKIELKEIVLGGNGRYSERDKTLSIIDES